MPHTFRRATIAATVALSAALLAPAAPAHATVHEIVAQWCSGQDELNPPGLTGGSNADNFAQPVVSTGFAGDPVPFDPPGDQAAGLLLVFNYDAKASKVTGTGVYVAIDQTPAGPLYIELIEPDPDFPAFRHCPALAG
jgi:hypothetical protein